MRGSLTTESPRAGAPQFPNGPPPLPQNGDVSILRSWKCPLLHFSWGGTVQLSEPAGKCGGIYCSNGEVDVVDVENEYRW